MAKILHVTAVDDSVKYVLANQLLWLQRAGHDVHVATLPGNHVRFIQEELGITFHPIRFQRTINPRADILALKDLTSLFRAERFDIVHTHMPKATLLGPLAAKIARVPHVVNTLRPVFNETFPAGKAFFFAALDRIALSMTDLVLAQNPDDIPYYASKRICARNKMQALGNGIDLQRFARGRVKGRTLLRQQLGFGDRDLVVGMVGRFVEDKGYEEFFGALRLVIDSIPRLRYLVVGPRLTTDHGVLSPDVYSAAELKDKGVILGVRGDMPEVLSAMDIFLFPSRRDVFPRALMEAAAMGLPLIASNISGCRRIVQDGRNGLLVNVRDTEGYASAVSRLALDATLRTRMGSESEEIAATSFDELDVFRKVGAAYETLLTAS